MRLLGFAKARPSYRVFYVIMVLTLVIYACFYLIGYSHPYSENPDFIEPRLTSVLLWFMIAVVALAAGVTIWAVFKSMGRRGKAEKKTGGLPVALISGGVAAATVVILLLSFLAAPSGSLNVNGSEYNDVKWLKAANMFVFSSLTLMAIASVSVIIATIRSHFHHR